MVRRSEPKETTVTTMTTKTATPTPTAPTAPPAPTAPVRPADEAAWYAQAAGPAKPARPKSAVDYRRDVDLAIIAAAGQLVSDLVPPQHRAAVARLIANQLHHLSTPTLGWPSLTLPTPDRSEWR